MGSNMETSRERFLILVYLIFSTAVAKASQSTGKYVSVGQSNRMLAASKYEFEEGSPELCPQDKVDRLQGLPGYGWDNLRNVEMSTIFEPKYHHCRLTTDKKYLIPDGLQVWPQKRTNLHIFSSLFENISDYSSAMSTTLNLDPGFSTKTVSQSGVSEMKVDGSFSFEYEDVKKHMARDNSVTTRSQCRYVFYKMQNDPDLSLSVGLKKRLYDLASAIQSNHSGSINYLSDLLVRDYGTHIVTKVDAGAAIVKEDQVSRNYVENHKSNKWAITLAAAGSFSQNFQSNFSLGLNFSYRTSKEEMQSYERNVTNSDIYSYGGPPLGSHLDLDKWLTEVSTNLVTVDRAGDPLWFLISPSSLPEIPLDTVRDVSDAVESAVKRYYEHNVYPGCTSIDSPNFSYIANIDDGTCHGPKTNYTFGGIYQSCSGGQCSGGKMQKNPMSGGYSCPSGFNPNLLYTTYSVVCKRKCKHSFWRGTYGCWDDCGSQYSAEYKAYWCVDTTGKTRDSGYMFGGVYSDNTANPVTQSKSCPPHYSSLRFGTQTRMYVCVSDDYELGYRYSLPFAGFFTCHAGNPLALSGAKPLLQLMNAPRRSNADQPNNLKLASYMYQEGPKNWPYRCPEGYSQHLLTIPENSCAIRYCIKTGAYVNNKLPVIRRPPFVSKPEILTNATRLLGTTSGKILSRSGDAVTWTELRLAEDLDESSPVMDEIRQRATGRDNNEPFSTATTAVVSAVSTAVVGLIVLMTALVCRRAGRRPESKPLLVEDADPILETVE